MIPTDFRNAILDVDSLAEVIDHPMIQYAVKIRPSHPRYFDRICETANNIRPMGVLVSVAQEHECFLNQPYTQPKLPFWLRVKLRWRRLYA